MTELTHKMTQYHFDEKKIPYITKSGIYRVEIVSVNRHISHAKREGLQILAMDIKSKKYMQFYLMLFTQRGKKREKDYELLQKFLILGNVFKNIEPDHGSQFFIDYKEKKISKKEGVVYKELIGKKYLIDLGIRLSYYQPITYTNYRILDIYKFDTQQTADEYIKNQIASAIRKVRNGNRKQIRGYDKNRYD